LRYRKGIDGRAAHSNPKQRIGGNIRSRAIIAIVMALVLATTVSGCGRRANATVESETGIRKTTTGQELMGLQEAYESRAMTEKEFQQQRKKILEQK
jgi:hypothetical protein